MESGKDSVVRPLQLKKTYFFQKSRLIKNFRLLETNKYTGWGKLRVLNVPAVDTTGFKLLKGTYSHETSRNKTPIQPVQSWRKATHL
jgi:hypothetical protein